MKQLLKKSFSKIAMLLSLLVINIQAWADTGEQTEGNRWAIAASKPEFWVGVVALIAIIATIASLNRRDKKIQANV